MLYNLLKFYKENGFREIVIKMDYKIFTKEYLSHYDFNKI